MEEFKDLNGNTVRLSFKPNSFRGIIKHVLVICEYKGQWLLTKHKKRGLEFPGGKVELDESLEGTATREVLEETGAVIDQLQYIGEYQVEEKNNLFIKAIFYGRIGEILPREGYLETDGPVLVEGDLLKERFEDHYSFIMKDRVIEGSIQFIYSLHKR